jgi:hypothetical protein
MQLAAARTAPRQAVFNAPERSASDWMGQRMVDATFTKTSELGGSREFTTPFKVDKIMQLEATTFPAAVSEASDLSAHFGFAFGVLQAQSGAFYTATFTGGPLLHKDRLTLSSRRDEQHGSYFTTETKGVEALDPALKAVVASDRFINFTGDKIDPPLGEGRHDQD